MIEKTQAEKDAYAAKHYGVREKDIEGKAGAYAKSRGGWHRKVKTTNNRGLPDRAFGHVDWPGRVFYIEFKRRGKKARAQQKLVIDEMREQGEIVFETDSLESAKEIIDSMFTFWEAP